MEISQEKQGDVQILAIKGRLDVTTTPDLEAAFAALYQANADKILVDCSELEYISSAGLRALLTAAKTSKKNGGKIVLCSLNENVSQIFEISGFTSIFEIFGSRTAAIGAM